MDKLTFKILVALQEGPLEGAAVLERLRASGGGTPSLPTLYRGLRACVREGWARVGADDAATGRGRPPRRYRLSARGKKALVAEAQRHQRLADLVLSDDAGAPESR